jgi:hypothetical protein
MASRKKNVPLSPSTTTPAADISRSGVAADLATIDEQGKAPRNRIKDAVAGHRVFIKMKEADRNSAFNRAILTEMWDGAPPQKDSALQQAGLGWIYNLNFLGADSKMAAAVAAYDDLIESNEHLIAPKVRPNILNADDLQELIDVVCEEHATMVREHSDFYNNWCFLAQQFVAHGVGFAYFPDAETPWWEPAGWDQVLIPRKTQIKDKNILVFSTTHEYRVTELYQKIEDKAHNPGWDETETRRAIVLASKGKRYAKRWYDHWPEVEMELKNNDIGFGVGDAECVQAVHYWIQEFDGSYSFRVGLEDGTNQNWLYSDVSRYKHANQAFISFLLSVGNRTFHSVRGALFKMFPIEQAKNRFENKMLTNTDISMTLLLQSENGDAEEDLDITLGPAVGKLPPGAKVVERRLPNVGTEGLPIVQYLDQKSEQATNQFQTGPVSAYADKKGHAQTKYAEQRDDSIKGSLAQNSVARFYRSADLMFSEQWRRVMEIGPDGCPTSTKKDEDGEIPCRYPEVRDFFRRCDERGVTFQMIKKVIRTVSAQRAIGNGSPQMRMLALDELQQMAGSLDETGRDNATRDRIAMRFGRVMADRYKPKVKRIAPDASLAQVENAALKSDAFGALPDQNHFVHAGIHVPKFQQIVEQLVSYRENDPEADFSPMEPILQWASNVHDHAAEHVQALAYDPLRVEDMKSFRAALEQGGNLLAGFARELQAQERHQQDMMGVKADGLNQKYQDAVSASDPKLTLEIQRQQEELQQKREEHALKMQLASYKVAQVAQKIRESSIKMDSLVAQNIDKQQHSQVPQAA